MAQNLSLTEEQRKFIINYVKTHPKPSLKELTRIVFDNKVLDGRSAEGRAIHEFLSEIGEKCEVRTPKIKPPLELTDQQKEFIESNFKRNMPALEIAKGVFNRGDITPLHKEARTVFKHIEEIKKKHRKYKNPDLVDKEGEPLVDEFEVETYYGDPPPDEEIRYADGPYKAPISRSQTIFRINKYLNYDWKEDQLKESQLKQVEMLKRFLTVFRFQIQINSYKKINDRELFEDTFIRYTHDKPDLSQEEIDQFITLSTESVIAADIQRRLEKMRMYLDDMSSDTEGKKLSMSLNEAINSAQTEYNQCIARQNTLYKSLTVNRSKRIAEQRSENASVLHLVKAWKQEDTRKKFLHLAEKRRELAKKAIGDYTSMDEIKAMMRGLTKEEALDG